MQSKRAGRIISLDLSAWRRIAIEEMKLVCFPGRLTCSRPFRPLGFAHLCRSRPRGSICSLLPSQLCLDHSHCLVLVPATLAALPSTRAIPDRAVFYVADPISSIRKQGAESDRRDACVTLLHEAVGEV